MRTVRVATRTSQLAMTQTQWVVNELRALREDWTFELVPIRTKGDRILDVTLSKIGGKGLFVSEIEEALRLGQADLAVHSMKDVPYELAAGLVIAGIPMREDARDVVVSRAGCSLAELPNGARVGTSSLRRMAQLRRARPDLRIEPLRGNIDTRLRRAEQGDFDAVVLAAAGLHRMGWQQRIHEYLSVDVCVPAVGQGVLAVECREDDETLVNMLNRWSHPLTVTAVAAERAFLRRLQGSCQVPIAGYATVSGEGLDQVIRLTGLVAHPAGSELLRLEADGRDPQAVGVKLAEELLARGADRWIQMALEEGKTDAR
ncbi:porphobilinogen deaminase [Alicyclobacillus hesperidum subsp. aegles]|uniref:hydroxymethylbilane synthase n=1 Tax=Alicyclobacillus hesperidum TaxID=89784 RepID=UPI0007191725|nr:hydroxymethylbilane synthase [Alicyclobacillus hesperidum]KRW92014.1 hydroxymethylbilane synthase [Alicyclobacillus tengchongensis]GLG00911.1 porphobilinogen deaminase [Alicyclobacillus hesperidum subsp. aegles]